MARRLGIAVLTCGALLAPGSAHAQNAQQLQTLVELRALADLTQKLQLSVNVLTDSVKDLKDQIKAASGRIDAQGTQVNTAFATQKTLIDSLTQAVGTLEQRVRDSSVDVRGLQSEMTAIRQGLGMLTDQITTLSQGQTPAAGGAPAGGGQGQTLLPDSPGELLQQARGFYTSSQYELAINAYQEFLKKFPTSPEAPKAQFWIGESYRNQTMYKEAIDAYTEVVTKFAGCGCEAEPESYFSRGLAYRSLKQDQKAIEDFKKIQAEYTKTKSPVWQTANDLASPILKQMIK